MGQITIDQSHQIMAILATNAWWENIDFAEIGLQDTIIRNPKGAGASFTKWLESGAGQPTLQFREDISIGPLTKRFVSREIFKGCDDWSSTSILTNEPPVEAGSDMIVLSSFDIVRTAAEHQIKSELPWRHEVELWHIADLINAQKNGEEGPLLTASNGCCNTFYVAGGAIHVVLNRCNINGPKWITSASECGSEYGAGGRVFSLKSGE